MATVSRMLGRQLQNKKFLNYRTPRWNWRPNSAYKRGVTRRFGAMRRLRRM